jgi:uncharacterized membrane protein YfcA
MRMTSQASVGGGRAKRGKKLNLGAIKANIVFGVGLITAVVGGLTGLGTQVALAPMLTWMLGFSAEKAQATAIRFAAIAAIAAVAGALFRASIPALYLARGLALFVGAFAGAIVTASPARRLQTVGARRVTQTLGIMVMLAVIGQAGRASQFSLPNFAHWDTPGALFGLGVVVGALTQLLSLPGGALMVPALYLFGGFAPVHAITLSLLVVALASVLPAMSYSRRGLADDRYLFSTTLSAVLGGALGGCLLPPQGAHDLFHYRILIMVSAAIAMFLCGRELSRLATATVDRD